jgi:hypothetical protein
MGLQRGGELGAVGLQHRDVVLDRQRVVDLPAEALGRHAGADALARGVHRGGSAGRAATDDQHVVRRLGAELGRVARGRTRVELGDDFFQPMRPEPNTVPFRKTMGTAMISRALTSSWKAPPSITVVADLRVQMAMRLSACTTSGQLWQLRDM